MNNTWNKFIYKIGSPIYDTFFNKGVFLKARKQVFKGIEFQPEQKILFVGVGTGADLELIDHSQVEITAIDYSPDMLYKAKQKFKNSSIEFVEMDAENMTFPNESFDIVVASLILSVVPNVDKCFQEMVRVVKREGQIVVFDKFVPKDKDLSIVKKFIRPIVSVLGTDIGVRFEDIFSKRSNEVILVKDNEVMLDGMYRNIVITKCS
ncbi:class I SAM-dependent methyltransferase [Halalkalibacter akibai]|uniref:Phosphatidylethanolamine N-methyltransferase n=1 Tax=Halalkalibacter akibai (strain ATCC 43226 / DSM 21942 / CIP 109018 / JCM 9157 / 1139) TaxID=1236973 RepID=W4R235_HALA3|nr:class I SAM-dependent methyltransferase [Halalkalibacter akibai]GAE37614.1 phosphatidylethanolamine N-methyltransferase [Halalkalibacter akibai JCM 9157]